MPSLAMLTMFVPGDPQLSVLLDNVWPMLSTAVVGLFLWWRNSAVAEKRHDVLLTQVMEKLAQETTAREKGEEALRTQMNGMGARIGKGAQEQHGMRTMLTGLDGNNGLKSDVRELLGEVRAISKSVTRLESDYTNTIRRLDELERAE